MKSKIAVKQSGIKKIRMIFASNMSMADKLKTFAKVYGAKITVIPLYLVLIALSAVFIVPFLYMIGHSMMSVNDLMNLNIKWLPRSLNLQNYAYAFSAIHYWKYLFRTLWVVGLCVFGQIMSGSFVAYGLARIKFKLNGLIFALIVFLLIVPPQTIIVPSFLMYSKIGWLDSFKPIIIPCFFSLGLNGGLMVFVFRQFYKSMPAELENAALIDGTGFLGAYFRIILPNAKPAILITSILSLVWQWNNYFEPSIYFSHVQQGTLTMQLQVLKDSLTSAYQTGVDYNMGISLAATFLSILPVLVIFFLLQKQFMSSVATSGLAN